MAATEGPAEQEDERHQDDHHHHREMARSGINISVAVPSQNIEPKTLR
jgi:hypothetical protein